MKTGYVLTALSTLLLLSFVLDNRSAEVDAADDPKPEKAPQADSTEIEPVESDMHEFMEYLCEEPYKRMREQLAAEPTDKKVWKGIKSDGLILAEAGNLLVDRGPADHKEAWQKQAVSMREAGRELYATAKTREFKPTREKWEALIVRCNACHKEFADGKHQLTP